MMQNEEVTSVRRDSLPEETVRLTVTLRASHRAALERIATQHERSLGWVVRDALRQYLGKAPNIDSSEVEAE